MHVATSTFHLQPSYLWAASTVTLYATGLHSQRLAKPPPRPHIKAGVYTFPSRCSGSSFWLKCGKLSLGGSKWQLLLLVFSYIFLSAWNIAHIIFCLNISWVTSRFSVTAFFQLSRGLLVLHKNLMHLLGSRYFSIFLYLLLLSCQPSCCWNRWNMFLVME